MIGIVILNYCSLRDVRECINSLTNGNTESYTIYIVDNKSPDQSGIELKEYYKAYPNIKVILNNHNYGYAAGNNIGLKYAIEDYCDYIVITNPDIIFMHNSISNMIKTFQISSSIGMVGPKIYNEDESIYQYGQRKKKTEIKELYFLKYPLSALNIGKVKQKMFYTKKELEFDMEVFTVSGCCFAISNSTARLLYPLDEGTFMYLEETIIGDILKAKGIKVYYTPKAEIIHNHRVKSKMLSPFNLMNKFMSEMYYCKKYLGKSNLYLIPLIFYYYSVYIYGTLVNYEYRKMFRDFIRNTKSRIKEIY
ncbi:MAG TPA: glycosyltransferase family 2 protein [Patescibacteria group bacterium]|nr:glycosyltransferase family 2 protein [Patescibacteria group bacterium]